MNRDASDFSGGDPETIIWLSLIAQLFSRFATHPLTFLPFSSILPITGFTALHSLRIAHLYHSVLASQGFRVGSRTTDVSYLQAGLVCTTLVMSGTTMAGMLKGQLSSLFSDGSGELVATYMLSGIGMKWLYPFIQRVPQMPLRILYHFVDGFATAFGTLSLGLIPTLNDPRMVSSTGNPLLLPIFGHPGFLSERLSVDFWGVWVIAAIYGTIVDGRGVFRVMRDVWSHGIFSITGGKDPARGKLIGLDRGPWMKPEEAHVLCSLILSGIYVLNEFGPNIFTFLDRGAGKPPSITPGTLDQEKVESGKSSSLREPKGQILSKRTSNSSKKSA